MPDPGITWAELIWLIILIIAMFILVLARAEGL